MSFGFSVLDFISLTQLAFQTVQKARQACGAHDELCREVNSLHTVLLRLQREAENPDSLLHQKADNRREELVTLVRGCRKVLKTLEQILEKYNALSEEKKSITKLWQRIKFGNNEMVDLSTIRGQLATHTNAITLFLNLLSFSSQGKAEKHMASHGADLRKLQQSVNWLIAERQSSGREGSVLTDYTNDDKNFWRELRRELIREGHSSSVLKHHKSVIKEYIAELGDRGALDDAEHDAEPFNRMDASEEEVDVDIDDRSPTANSPGQHPGPRHVPTVSMEEVEDEPIAPQQPLVEEGGPSRDTRTRSNTALSPSSNVDDHWASPSDEDYTADASEAESVSKIRKHFETIVEYVCNTGIEYTDLPKFKLNQGSCRSGRMIQNRAIELGSLLAKVKHESDRKIKHSATSYFQQRLEDLDLILSTIVVLGGVQAAENNGKIGETTNEAFRIRSVEKIVASGRENLYGEVIQPERFDWIANIIEGPLAPIEVLITGMKLFVQSFKQKKPHALRKIDTRGTHFQDRSHPVWNDWQVTCQHRQSGFSSLGSVIDRETWCCKFCTLENIHESLSDSLDNGRTRAAIIETALPRYWRTHDELTKSLKEAQDNLENAKRIRANGDISQELLGVHEKTPPQWYRDGMTMVFSAELTLARFERTFQFYVDYIKFGRGPRIRAAAAAKSRRKT